MSLKNVLFASLLAVNSLSAVAQQDFDLAEGSNVWLNSSNAAGVQTLRGSSLSKAELSGSYESGNLRNFSDGKDVVDINVGVRSYNRFSDVFAGYGRVSYRNVSGKDMQGSVLMQNNNELMPFDIVESTTDYAGKKHGEFVNIAGGFGWNVRRNLSIGANADFTAGNYRKYRDLRHCNFITDINAAASALYTTTDNIMLGGSFLYRRRIESMRMKTYGTNDVVYQSLIAYANMLGTTETFTVDGFTGTTEQPLLNEYVGFGLQTEIPVLSNVSVYGEFDYLHRNGYYGKYSQFTQYNSKHRGDEFKWSVRLKLDGTDNVQWLDININTSKLTSDRCNYLRVQAQSNSSVIYYEYYTPTKMSDKLLTEGSAVYNGYFGKHDGDYMWNIKAGTSFWHRNQTAYLYPYYRSQSLMLWEPFATLSRSFFCNKNRMITAELGAGYHFGSGDICSDGTLAQPSSQQSLPAEQSTYLNEEYEYLTSGQILAHAKVGYRFMIPQTKVYPTIALSYGLKKSSDNDYIGNMRSRVILSVSAEF